MTSIAGVFDLAGASVPVASLQALEARPAEPNISPSWRHIDDTVGMACLFPEYEPCFCETDEYLIVADARLGRRQQLIEQLSRVGREPRSDADAGLIGDAYATWGRDCLDHLYGDFAFAIWDRRIRSLFAARDRMGSRGLYFCYSPGKSFLWATTCAQLLQHPAVSRKLDHRMVAAHLYPCSGQHDWSYFADISQLRPGHFLQVDQSSFQVRRYWKIDSTRSIRYARDDEYEERYRSLLTEIVAENLGDPESTGILLSGGLDSGSIVSIAGQQLGTTGQSLQTFCWAFEQNAECDERRLSNTVVDAYNCLVAPIAGDGHWLYSDLDHAPAPDDPALLICPPLLRATLVRAQGMGIRAIMMGTGANALLDGDRIGYLDHLVTRQYCSLWRQLRRDRSQNSLSWPRMAWAYLLRPLVKRRYPVSSLQADSRVVPPWIKPDFARQVGIGEILRMSAVDSKYREPSKRSRYDFVMGELESRSCLAERKLFSEYGIDHRLPFRDVRLLEFIMAIPSDQIWRPRESKSLARRAMRGILPDEVRTSRHVGTVAPMRTVGLRFRARSRIEAMLRSPLSAELGFIDADILRNEYAHYCDGARGEYPLNYAIELEVWLRRLYGER